MTTRKTGPAPRRSSLLVELGVEELPPATLKTLAEAFAAGFVRRLTEAGVVDNQQVDDQQANNQQAKNQQAENQAEQPTSRATTSRATTAISPPLGGWRCW